MSTIYIIIVAFLLILAVFDLFVGVSNDAVNFLNSGIGARVAKWRTLLIMAVFGVLIGSMMSAGMMDVARHGIMLPNNFSFHEVMVVFLAVMVTDVIVLDRFNSMGLPTSTTVSLVFELFGAATLMTFVKMAEPGNTIPYAEYINTDKCLSVIIAIFVSVAIAFICGIVLQWISRLVFTFQSSKVSKVAVAIFGGISFTILAYFIFLKGFGKSPYLSADVREWVDVNTRLLIVAFFVVTTLLSFLLIAFKVNVFKIVVLLGTFALAMAFAGNDLVNFIGVPLAGLDSFLDWQAAGSPDPNTFMMTSLLESAKSPMMYLLGAGIIMVLAIAFSKKAMNVVKTSVDLSRQDEGDEMFGSSRAARSIVRMVESWPEHLGRFVPSGVAAAVAKRFDNSEAEMEKGAAFDVVRAAVNLVVSSVLIVIGTNYKLPLSTTYVTFMVAMGTSLADKAWGRETAVFRVTGVLAVIGGWFITAGVAFIAAAIVCALMYYLGFVAMVILMVVAAAIIIKSNFFDKDKEIEEAKAQMRGTTDSANELEVFRGQLAANDSHFVTTTSTIFNDIVDGFFDRRIRALRHIATNINEEQKIFSAKRRHEMLEFGKVMNLADKEQLPATEVTSFSESSLWLQLGEDCRRQYLHSLRRMLDPVIEHVDNGFNPATPEIISEFAPVRRQVTELFEQIAKAIETGDYSNYNELRTRSAEVRKTLKLIRHAKMDAMQQNFDSKSFKVMMVYINLLRESQNLVNVLRHHIEASKCFAAPASVSDEERKTLNNDEY